MPQVSVESARVAFPPGFRRIVALVLALGSLVPVQASAQAGPPMIANDPGTPGNNNWEINVAALGALGGGEPELDAPYFDVNYGLGDRVQLSIESPWAQLNGAGEGWSSGIAEVEYGLRWRFIDQEADHAPVSVAIQAFSTEVYARRKELAAQEDEFDLPLQVAHEGEGVSFGGEVVRHLVHVDGGDYWQAGVYAKTGCAQGWECLGELNDSWDGGSAPIVNFGARHPIAPHWILLASFGKQLAAPQGEAKPWIFYLGVQFLSHPDE